MSDEPPSISEALQEGREERLYAEPLYLTDNEMGLLMDAVADWLANALTSTPTDLHHETHYTARFQAMVDLGNKLGMDL